MAGRRDCYGGRTGKVGAFCPRGWAIKISIRFPRELSQPFLRPSSHLASVFSPLIKLHPRRANGGSTGLQRTHFVIISFNDEGSCHPSLCLLPLSAPAYTSPRLPPLRNIFIACPRLDGRDATEFEEGLENLWPSSNSISRSFYPSNFPTSLRLGRRREDNTLVTLIPIIQILEGENEYANERILTKISESRRIGLLIKFRKCRARGIQRGSELIDMHDVGAKDPTLPCSSPFFVRPPRTREKNAPSRGKQFLGRGMGWMERWRCTSSHVLRRGNLLPRLGGSR